MRRSTSPPPPLSPSGLLPSCNKAGDAAHTPLPARGDSSALQRENSEARLSNLESALTKLENYAEAMKNNDIQTNGVRFGKEVVGLVAKVYHELPPRVQEQVRAELNATIFQGAQEDGPPKPKRTSTKRLIDWSIENILLPIGFGLLAAFIIRLFYRG